MHMNLKSVLIPLLIGSVLLSFIACSEKTGNLMYTANGEEFIVSGLTSKEGWALDFEKVLININSPTAYNPENPKLKSILEGDHLVDLTRGSAEKPEVAVGIVPDAEAANYQSLKYRVKQMNDGEYEGYSIVLKGTAAKDGETIHFLIKLDEELTFDGREGYVGDSIKGILKEGETTDVEMTFHFDHLFGNNEMEAEDHVNSDSPGFGLFLEYRKGNVIDVSQKEMINNPLYGNLVHGIETLGHLGEGHCEVSR